MKIWVIKTSAYADDEWCLDSKISSVEEPAYFKTKEGADRMENLLNEDYRNMGIWFETIEKIVIPAPYEFVEDILGKPTVEQFAEYIINKK